MSIENSSEKLSLFIPHVHYTVTKEFITSVFEQKYKFGKISYIDLVPKITKNGQHYNSVYIYFEQWSSDEETLRFIESVKVHKNDEHVFYNDSYYWIVCQNKFFSTNNMKTPENVNVIKKPIKNERKPKLCLDISKQDLFEKSLKKNKVAIIVPFRECIGQKRSEQLRQFVPYMSNMLSKSSDVTFCIYIIEQSNDCRKFNRGKLLNIGYNIAKKDGCNNFVFHDVDLIPSEDLLKYYTNIPEENRPVHIAKIWNRYSGDKYFGGIVAFSGEQFEKLNGFPNNFWGWGGEDDELRKRVDELNFKPVYPLNDKGNIIDMEQLSLNDKLAYLKKNKDLKCNIKYELLVQHEESWKTNGLSDLDYNILNETQNYINNNTKKILVDVKLNANHWSNNYASIYKYVKYNKMSQMNEEDYQRCEEYFKEQTQIEEIYNFVEKELNKENFCNLNY